MQTVRDNKRRRVAPAWQRRGCPFWARPRLGHSEGGGGKGWHIALPRLESAARGFRARRPAPESPGRPRIRLCREPTGKADSWARASPGRA